MAQKLDLKETVSRQDPAYTNMMGHAALLRLLTKKGIITKERNTWKSLSS